MERVPDSVAVFDGHHEVGRREIDGRADRIAGFLAGSGIGPESVVGIRLPAGADLASAVLGVWRAGAAVLPLDADGRADAAGVTADLVLTDGREKETTAGSTLAEALLAAAIAAPVDVDPQAAAWIAPGADGGPAAVLDHATVVNQVTWLAEDHGLDATDRVLVTGPAGAATWALFAALTADATAVLPAPAPHPARLLAAAAEQRATVLVAPAAALTGATGATEATEAATATPDLRLVLALGAALPPAAGRALAARAEEVRTLHVLEPGALILTADDVDPARETAPESTAHESTATVLGRPVDQVRVLVVDEYGDPVPPGVPGELHVAGLGLPRGWAGDPKATADRLRPAFFGAPGSRMHNTGTPVRWRNDGTLEQLDEAVAAPAPAPAPAAGYARPAYVAPATAAERAVAQVWSELLEVAEVGAEDNFFQLGGYSLLLTELARRLHTATGTTVVLADLFTAVTVREQAALLAVEETPATSTATSGATSGTTNEQAVPGVVPVPRDRPLPLSSGQRRIWLLDTMEPGPEWAAPFFLRVPADLDAGTVRLVLDTLADRHEVLRTRYRTVDGEPVQEVGETLPIELRTVEGSREQVVELFREQFETPFDLAAGRIWRATLAATPEAGDERLLLVTIHHIACDGWSVAVLEDEFRTLCAAYRAGTAPRLPEPPVQYADYASWERQWHTKDRLAGELDHWRGVLDGLVPLELPTDHPRPARRDPRGGVVGFGIPPRLMDAVTRLGQSREATPFMTLLTAFGTLLARHSGQWDVVVGTPVAGRTRPEVERTVGFFLNSLVLRCRLDGGLPFTEALDRLRATCLDAFAHQELSFEHIVDELNPERDLSRTPLYQVAFNLHDGRLIGGMPDRADLDYLHPARRVAKTDLTLYVRSEADGTWSGAFEYAAALFEHGTVERLAEQFLRLLETFTADPATALGAAELLSAPERARLLGDWGTGERADWPAGTTLDLIEAQAATTPDAPAVVTDGATLSYRELDERANRLAHHLAAAGAGPETVVGVCLERGPDLVPALLAIWKAGAAYLPLDPALPAERLRHVLADCRAPLLVTETALTATTGGFPGTRILLDADREAVAARPATAPARATDPEHPAYLIYTSGSTGRPKGVTVHHRGLANHLRWAARDLVRGPGGAPLFSSLAFDLPATNLYVPLITGRPVHVLPADLDLGRLGETLAAGAPYSFVKLTPGHLELLTDQLTGERAAGLADLVLVAGEALPARTANHWLAALGPGRLINEYGPTEASIGSTAHPVDRPQEGTVPLGGPLPNTTAYVLDGAGRPAPVGVAGELHVGGAGLARGYHGRPDLTAERFVPDPYGPAGSRLYRTGDLARVLDGGAIEFLGRIDTQVKLRGYRIELGEIEAVLTANPAVRDAVVLVRESTTGEKSLAAYVVPEGGEFAADALRADLAEVLPEYMVPSAVAAVERIPLTANGKVDRRALPAIEQAVGDQDAPGTPTEERIAEVWAELLGLPSVGVHDSFFELGGHSILAIRMTSRLQDEFDVDLSIATVFGHPTVSRLAEAVEDLIRAEIEQLDDSELGDPELVQ
ncbi:amino acid adenylation domain-containing protein [Kitasatospora purpeofusca]|uniref:non-ribosomal peptide synthetase n=1 Tax=Kitasatospora purpeofusca TaxID=67352 RepID=UPI00225A0F54|nr:non-ribosomal peptide synthetase [Kitasatospora purpeofusca]MCX4687128.1 amino acid adenylation domain-containing protein [Kitasatospora purpeofusca]